MSRLCSAPWTTCWVAKVISNKFLPRVPVRVRRRRVSSFSFSSWVSTPRDWSNWETISRFSFT